MDHEQAKAVAELLHERNAIDAAIAGIIDRPVTATHLGRWIAAQIFDIQLADSATSPIAGRFRSGPLQGSTVSIRWYMKHEGLLDSSASPAFDYYLVLTGPPSPPVSSRGTMRPWCIEMVFLFNARQLRDEQIARGARLGTASSVTRQQWNAAEVFPSPGNRLLPVTPQQAGMLRLFGPRSEPPRRRGLFRRS